MGHYATGDCGFVHRTFSELAYLAAPRGYGGVGLGQNALELRWELYDEDDEVDTVFLTDLPAELRARFERYPLCGDDILVPMPCRLPEVAELIAADMRAVAPALQAAREGCASVRIALTPSYRLHASEIDAALALLRSELPVRLRPKLERRALAAEKSRSRRKDMPDTPLIDALAGALPSQGDTFLLCLVTWFLWHPKKRTEVGVTDDSTLYEVSLRQKKIRLSTPVSKSKPKECVAQVDAWEASLFEFEEGADPARLREERDEVMGWALGLPLRHPRVADALTASAHAWGLLGLRDRAVAELAWALLLRPTPDRFNARGYQRHLGGDLEGAVADYTAALKGKRDAMFFANRAEAHFDLGRAAPCIADARAALKLDPKNAEAKALFAKARRLAARR